MANSLPDRQLAIAIDPTLTVFFCKYFVHYLLTQDKASTITLKKNYIY